MLCRDLEENRFVTLLLVCLDASKGCLSYAGAGHVPGYLLGASGETERVLESSGPPLGLFPNSRYRTAAIPLLPQQLLVLMTDGITEIAGEDDDGFGTDGVLEYVRAHASEPARDIADGVYRAARAAAAGSPQADDVTEVIVRVCQSVTGA
jgi:serine phosphatase RsbU (regulator of sigma subunit)